MNQRKILEVSKSLLTQLIILKIRRLLPVLKSSATKVKTTDLVNVFYTSVCIDMEPTAPKRNQILKHIILLFGRCNQVLAKLLKIKFKAVESIYTGRRGQCYNKHKHFYVSISKSRGIVAINASYLFRYSTLVRYLVPKNRSKIPGLK